MILKTPIIVEVLEAFFLAALYSSLDISVFFFVLVEVLRRTGKGPVVTAAPVGIAFVD
jgi:hypothetical protein